MPAPEWEDLDEFFDEFAVDAVILTTGGQEIPVTGIFDDPYVGADLGEYDHDTDGPTFNCRYDAVRGVKRRDTITINFPSGAQTFDIMTSPQPDGTGLANLELSRP